MPVQIIASIGASARVTRSRDMHNTQQRGSRPAADVLDPDTQRDDARIDDTDPGAQMRTSVRRQREQFGGLNWGSAFFGWLVAVGIAALLSAAGAAVGLTKAATDAADNPGTVGIVGGVLLLVILLVAYYAGGYVAG